MYIRNKWKLRVESAVLRAEKNCPVLGAAILTAVLFLKNNSIIKWLLLVDFVRPKSRSKTFQCLIERN